MNNPTLYSAFVRKPAPLLPYVAGSVVLHGLLLGGVLLFSVFKFGPAIDLDRKPIKASLVRLGKQRDQKLLPRKEELPPPPKEVKSANVAEVKPPPDQKIAVPVPGQKPQQAPAAQPGDKAAQEQRQKLFGAFDKLGKTKPPEELEGAADGDPDGDSATQEGERYYGLINAQVKRFYDVSQTISEQERMHLRAEVALFIGRTGEVSSVKLARSSGNDLFDAAVLAAVNKASPLSPPPPELQSELQQKGIVLSFRAL